MTISIFNQNQEGRKESFSEFIHLTYLHFDFNNFETHLKSINKYLGERMIFPWAITLSVFWRFTLHLKVNEEDEMGGLTTNKTSGCLSVPNGIDKLWLLSSLTNVLGSKWEKKISLEYLLECLPHLFSVADYLKCHHVLDP